MVLPNFLSRSTATPVADLVIDGLAVCCFDRRVPHDLHWEVAFLRDPHHHLELRVTEKTLDDEAGSTYNPYPVPDNLVTLDFIMDNGSSDHYLQYENGYYCTTSPFLREVNHDHQDFRWVIDFIGNEVRHGTFDGLKQKSAYPDRVNVTLLSVPNSLCYTKELTKSPVIVLPSSLNDPCEGTLFGHTNATIGAVVFAALPGKIKIRGRDQDGTMLSIRDLEYKPGQYYEIKFTNMDQEKREALLKDSGPRASSVNAGKVKDYQKGDFHRFYEVISVTGPEKTLWGHKNVQQGKLGDCHAVMVNSNISTLEPLLD